MITASALGRRWRSTMRFRLVPSARAAVNKIQCPGAQELPAYQTRGAHSRSHTWTEGDVLVRDHIRTIHMAVADYGADEHRLMRRCQVMADRVFDPDFLRSEMAAGTA
jgi:hypothetical protein